MDWSYIRYIFTGWENITALWAYLKSDRTQRDWEDFKMTIEGIDLKYNQQAADRNRDFG